MKNNKLFGLLAAVCVLNLLGHAACLPLMPEEVPIHWNWEGVADGFGPKWSSFALGALPLGLLVLFWVMPRIDPKGKNFDKFRPVWKGMMLAIVLLGCAISWMSELAVFGVLQDGSAMTGILIGGGVGLLFILLGNYMPRIKQNYTFGCRTPWALADEHNWNRTQRMGGITFVVMGVALLFLGLFAKALGEGLTLGALLVVVLGGTAWIFVYSFLVFKKIMR